MKKKHRKTKTKGYEQIKNFAIAILALVILIVIAINVQDLKIGSSKASWPTLAPTPATTKIAYPQFLQDTAGLPTVLVPGTTNALFRFKVTAVKRQVALKKLAFLIDVWDKGVRSDSTDVGGFTLLGNGGGLVDVDIRTWKIGAPYSVNAEVKGTGDIEGDQHTRLIVQFGNRPWEGGEVIIPKGATVTYTLQGITGTGFMASEDDSIVTSLTNGLAGSPDRAYLNDYDVRPNNAVVMRQNQYGYPYTDELIWSDMSVVNHSAKFDDLGIQTLSSKDWWNGFGLKYFPMEYFWLVA